MSKCNLISKGLVHYLLCALLHFAVLLPQDITVYFEKGLVYYLQCALLHTEALFNRGYQSSMKALVHYLFVLSYHMAVFLPHSKLLIRKYSRSLHGSCMRFIPLVKNLPAVPLHQDGARFPCSVHSFCCGADREVQLSKRHGGDSRRCVCIEAGAPRSRRICEVGKRTEKH